MPKQETGFGNLFPLEPVSDSCLPLSLEEQGYYKENSRAGSIKEKRGVWITVIDSLSYDSHNLT